ncbi:MAG TPA: FAD-dependent oxidoreductase [Myxococcota bacterium]|nr:FAD-dependent oxidoreductase [Myxococcales bacterium]HPG24735.1 FAD-dependent oxidoreductase [Myxococcota bacterium]
MQTGWTRRRFLAGATALAGVLVYGRRARAQTPQDRHAYAVIGRGPMASAAARHLATAGEDVVLVGPPEPVDGGMVDGAFASHYDEMRQIELAIDSLLLGQLAKASLPAFRRLEEQTGIRFIEPNPGLRTGFPAYAEQAWGSVRDVAAKLSVDVEDLGATELARRFPGLRFPDDAVGLLEPGGAIINPRRLVRAQLEAAQQAGATIVDDVAKRLVQRPGEVVIETKGGRSLRAEQALVATGAFVNQTGLLERPLALSLVGQTIVQVEVGAGPHPPMPIVTAVLPGEAGPEILYAMPPRRFPDGKTYVKGNSFRWSTRRIETDGDDEGAATPGVVNDPSIMVGLLEQMVPGIEASAVSNRSCMTAYTPSGAPYIDRVAERVGVAVGGNAWGIMTSEEIGRLAAAMMRGKGWSGALAPEIFAARFA